MLGNFESSFVEVGINFSVGIVRFDESDGLFELFGALIGLPRVLDVILELMVFGSITKGRPSRGMYVEFRMSVIHRSIPHVSGLGIGFLGWRMGLWDALVEAMIFGVAFLWNFLERMGRDAAIVLSGFCGTLPMW